MLATATRRKRRKIEPWEAAFIRLVYYDFKASEIGEYLNRSADSIREAAHRKLNIKKRVELHAGDKFGRLVIERLESSTPIRGKVWLCRCKCGNTITAETNTLTSGHSQSCGCARIESCSTGCGFISGKHYGKIRANANTRKIPFGVSIEYLDALFKKQEQKCSLTNIPIKIDTRRVAYASKETTASLDRIDSTRGYIEGNVQWVHKDINWMKLDYEQDYFIEMCERVAKHAKRNRKSNPSGNKK